MFLLVNRTTCSVICKSAIGCGFEGICSRLSVRAGFPFIGASSGKSSAAFKAAAADTSDNSHTIAMLQDPARTEGLLQLCFVEVAAHVLVAETPCARNVAPDTKRMEVVHLALDYCRCC